MLKRLATTGVAATVVAFGLTACSDTNGIGGSDTSRVTVQLTDAPSADVTAAVVTISKIYLSGSSADQATEDEVLMSTPVTTDLLTLSNDVMTLVDGESVKAGTYGQMRFVIDGAYIVVNENGTEKVYATDGYDQVPEDMTVDGTLKCPSCAQSGLKVTFPGGALDLENDANLLVDFNVEDSFGHQAGNSGMWIMHPSLKATEVQLAGDVKVTAALSQDLIDAGGLDAILAGTTLGDFEAELKSTDADPSVQGETVAFTDADSDGTYEADFGYVVPGTYDVSIIGPMDAGTSLLDFVTDPVMPQQITVDESGQVTVDFVLTAASLAAGG